MSFLRVRLPRSVATASSLLLCCAALAGTPATALAQANGTPEPATVPHPSQAPAASPTSQAPPPSAQVPIPSPSPGPAAATTAVPTDRLLFSPDAYCGSDKNRHSCRLGDTLFVGFTNLREWMGVSTNHVSDIVLVLNGRVMAGLTSRGPDDSYKGLQFDLKRLEGEGVANQSNRDTWNALIPELRTDGTLHVAVASGGRPPFWGSADVRFQVFPRYTWVIIAFLLVLLIGFILIARRSDILRDAPSSDGTRCSYSLARAQMAWWFFIVLASFCYVWLTVNNYDSLTAGVLILTGISAATGLASVVIDSNKREQRLTLEAQRRDLQAKLATSQAAIAADPAGGSADLRAQHVQAAAQLAAIDSSLASLPSPVGASEGFLRDILRDETGISFHRFQMAAWTIVLGFVFISAVYRQLVMPDFSPTLLGLMGISSGTYIGFKIPDSPK